jgi:hypothetical protein
MEKWRKKRKEKKNIASIADVAQIPIVHNGVSTRLSRPFLKLGPQVLDGVGVPFGSSRVWSWRAGVGWGFLLLPPSMQLALPLQEALFLLKTLSLHSALSL